MDFLPNSGHALPVVQEFAVKKRARRDHNHTPAFKTKLALTAIKGDRTLGQLAEQFDVCPN